MGFMPFVNYSFSLLWKIVIYDVHVREKVSILIVEKGVLLCAVKTT